MIFTLLLTALAATKVTLAGVLHGHDVLHRRAGLSPAKILEELTNVNGRDFCHDYIGAEVRVLYDISTIVETKVVPKVINTKVTETSTETIGTLRKGTTTTTVLHTVTSGTPGVTVNVGPTIMTTITVTTTGVTTKTVYYNAAQARRRKRDLALPEILTDSDPINISAACTKIINKFPIYTTAASATTKPTTTTVSTPSTSTVVKVQKVTKIDPYLVKMVSSLVIVGNDETATISVDQFATETETEIIGPTTTVTIAKQCDLHAMHRLREMYYTFPLAGVDNSHNVQSIYMDWATPQACCEACWRYTDPQTGLHNCVFYKVTGDMARDPTVDVQHCYIFVQKPLLGPGAAASCPAARFGIAVNRVPEHLAPERINIGPCFGFWEVCYDSTKQECLSRTNWYYNP